MHSIKGLLFDKDGTLFDFNATWGRWAADFFHTLAGAQAPQLAANLGFDIQTQKFDPKSVVIAGTPHEIATAVAHHLPDRTTAELVALMTDTAQHAQQVQVTPLKPLLTALHTQGFTLGVATNDAESPARAHLDAAGITDLFHFIAGYDSGFGSKPEPGMQQAFCAAQNLAPAQVAMIGDATHDLIAGRAAGMVTVGVLTGPATQDDLSPFADVVLPTIKELPNWLSKGL